MMEYGTRAKNKSRCGESYRALMATLAAFHLMEEIFPEQADFWDGSTHLRYQAAMQCLAVLGEQFYKKMVQASGTVVPEDGGIFQ